MEDFFRFRDIVYKEAGIYLAESKRVLLTNRIRKRLQALKIPSYAEYYNYLQKAPDRQAEIGRLVDVVTTNVTEFFRNPKQFEDLRTRILPIIEERNRLKHSVHILSAGCSSGEEPYSIAIVLKEHFGTSPIPWLCLVDAVDICSEVLQKASEGVYPRQRMAGVSEERIQRFFRHEGEDLWRVKDEIRQMVRFRRLNLNADPLGGPYDIIFCRNVVIYFDEPTKNALYDKFHAALVPGGYLFVGYSEGILNDARFKYLAPGIYLRQDLVGR